MFNPYKVWGNGLELTMPLGEQSNGSFLAIMIRKEPGRGFRMKKAGPFLTLPPAFDY
jgi:hypothetical protein